MRSLLLALATGAALSVVAISAQAMPADGVIAPESSPLLTFVADGCGPGYHRGGFGACRPNGGFFRPRGCFVRPTPYGPRRVCR